MKENAPIKNPMIIRWLSPFIKNNTIECAQAHNGAGLLDRPPIRIGEQLDLLGCKIIHCQLGLFGSKSHSKQFDTDYLIPENLEQRLQELQNDNQISCKSCWELSEETGIDRLKIGSACEIKGLKIKPCQLGVF